RSPAEALAPMRAFRGTFGAPPASDSSCCWYSWRCCGPGPHLQPQPEWDTPPDGALRARCINGAQFYIKLTSPADSVWKGGPTVFRCDGPYMRDAMKCRGW